RVACDEIRRRHDRVDYFAAYEAVLAGGPEWAFESDRRSVTPEAVAHVMECFRRQFGLARRDSEAVQATTSEPVHVVAMPDSTPRRHPAPMCDEDQILAAMARERTR
ncbi:MAG: GSCFA domain-containing protein, partial [Planctomycetes bacterium]|nr:GSCFA domain-containing protein [Planctomycetota bacterium]